MEGTRTMKKQDLPITEISLEDFYKLNLYGYELRPHYYNKSDQRIPDNRVFVTVPAQMVDGMEVEAHVARSKEVAYSKITWDKVSLNEKVKAEVEASLRDWTDEQHKLLIAVHTEPSEADIKAFYDVALTRTDPYTGKKFTEAQAREIAERDARFTFSYLDKYLTPIGSQTYILSNFINKLYSTRDYYEERELGLKVPKRGTKAIYLIKYR